MFSEAVCLIESLNSKFIFEDLLFHLYFMNSVTRITPDLLSNYKTVILKQFEISPEFYLFGTI